MNPALLAALDAGATVVTPNRRLARHLRREFDLEQQRRGRAAWSTPSILPYHAWLETLWKAAVEHGADDGLLLSPWQSTLQWRQIVESDAERMPLLDSGGAAALAADAWSLVHEWGTGHESWRAWREAGGVPDDPAVFARWAETYASRLRSAGARDFAVLPDAVAAVAAQQGGQLPLTVIAGFDELTPQHERLLAALRAAGASLQRVDPLPPVNARVVRASAVTPREEIAAALAWARQCALSRPDARVGIVVEDLLARRDEVVALAEDILSPAARLPAATSRAAFEISLGPPLAAVPLVVTALDLIALAELSLPMGAVAALLRSPYLAGPELAWTDRARAEREWLCRGRLEVTLADAIAALERTSPELATRWRAARDVQRALPHATPRQWSDAWRAWLDGAGWPGWRPLDSDEYQVRLAWEKLLTEFASLGSVAPRLSPARAVSTLRALATERRFQPEGAPAAVQILGVLEGSGLAFDALWVAGLAADRWPAAPRPNPLLPLAWQRERNVAHATADRERAYAQGLTARFARAAAEVVFSAAASADDHPLSPSALILRFPQRDAPSRPPSWIGAIARSAVPETLSDDRAPPVPRGSKVPGGSRIVAAQSDCPFQAAVRCRLRTEPWPQTCAGLTPLERGAMVHVALAHFWSAARDHATLVALDAAALDRHLRDAVASALAEVSASRWSALPALLREGETLRLQRLLRAWLALERARPPFTAQALEQRVALQLAGLELSLRLDRVDALAGGGLAIIDYKTGQVERPRQWFDTRPRSPQLGLYTLAQLDAAPECAVRAIAYAELRAEGVSASGLAVDDAAWPELESVALAPGGTWASLVAWWRRHLETLGAEIAAGHAAVSPRVAPSPCRNCGLQPVCRIESVRAIDPNGAADE